MSNITFIKKLNLVNQLIKELIEKTISRPLNVLIFGC